MVASRHPGFGAMPMNGFVSIHAVAIIRPAERVAGGVPMKTMSEIIVTSPDGGNVRKTGFGLMLWRILLCTGTVLARHAGPLTRPATDTIIRPDDACLH
jgi:hypothetical protein